MLSGKVIYGGLEAFPDWEPCFMTNLGCLLFPQNWGAQSEAPVTERQVSPGKRDPLSHWQFSVIYLQPCPHSWPLALTDKSVEEWMSLPLTSSSVLMPCHSDSRLCQKWHSLFAKSYSVLPWRLCWMHSLRLYCPYCCPSSHGRRCQFFLVYQWLICHLYMYPVNKHLSSSCYVLGTMLCIWSWSRWEPRQALL